MRLTILAAAGLLSACGSAAGQTPPPAEGQERAVFAGGCFWCIEAAFDDFPGVVSAMSGFTGGRVENPTYYDVVFGNTGHYESVEVIYDPAQVTYEALLREFWVNIDPTDFAGQFCDRGDHYRTAIFVSNDAQRAAAEASVAALRASGRFGEVATEVLDAEAFYVAGPEHQDYHIEYAEAYSRYRNGCRPDAALNRIWGEDADALLGFDG